MFLDFASYMKSLYSTVEKYLHKAERTFPSLFSILKSSKNGQFLKVLPSVIFSSGSHKKRKNQGPPKYYILKLKKYLFLSICKTFTLNTLSFVFSTKSNFNIICEGEQLLIHLVRLTTKEEKWLNMSWTQMRLYWFKIKDQCECVHK